MNIFNDIIRFVEFNHYITIFSMNSFAGTVKVISFFHILSLKKISALIIFFDSPLEDTSIKMSPFSQ